VGLLGLLKDTKEYMANLRILYNNVATSANITASSTAGGLAPSNMLNYTKGLVWRSSSTTATIYLNWSDPKSISAVILPFNNLTNTSTIKVRLYTGVSGGTLAYTSAVLPAIVGTFENWGSTSSGVNRYSFGKSGCTAVWLPLTLLVTKIEIDIIDTNNPDLYLEASSILVGAYWSPVRNTSIGVDLAITDLSENTRTQSGNLITNIGPNFRTLKFNLDYMPVTDRNILLQILKINGMHTPIFVSLFPTDINSETISIYQIYGKVINSASILHPIYSFYSSSLDIEEV